MTERFPELVAPAPWRSVELISDLHLQAGDAATHGAWLAYLARTPRPDALFILGDLFEVWVGDDLLADGGDDDPDRHFWRGCARALRNFSAHTPTFFIAGNRDFLLGPEGLSACGMTGLHDPTVLVFGGRRWLLSHGDALCLADTDYQAFRAQVRSTDWQRDFLSRPLAERQDMARELRARSEARKRTLGPDPSLWADVDGAAASDWLARADAATLIHGHTHRPGEHALGQGRQRIVLSDWHAGARPPRAEALRLSADGGARRVALA
ncbi:MAG: UDP-2,3-diacylglucosamine diphosphatase [Hydrogenophaga sp.]|uniref:UDP-2,3-diacylglucosamine diphosphatase n=1 Tax=Hydrogenophaga sp. TaxID=1904254 RepID=UPI00169D5B84|nr:UDP-2,3-diacylglucosamine diphosphatase [Hydrogenophaga sp.]NIM40769.1 UDP-2,3-diacylglucosamine diphosphatase [Hydrogenophaga sp.]NIN26244.1 UDP-2,3-diacylglucosamine diphosphatase [Hydrogenophaga sp.]NIN31109.1 UDP-2,3-diacylglucosamine diphosphatase [Hydrogenophaga sp.]NIN55152.1 UDP-2,3-diacylglucosamine diphosphatase [Hydrogenophaga sp.]NIO51195.1 UDP-2,3-diacylglucosamine diphosphatase [Hydrogenophaga sp.]